MAEHNHINDSRKSGNDEKIRQYLHEEMNEEERMRFEKEIVGDEFESEALQGLKLLNKNKIPLLVDDLNVKLKKQIRNSRKRNNKLLSSFGWIYYAVVLILILILISYWILNKLHH